MSLKIANEKFNAGEMQQAAEMYEQILVSEPNNYVALHNLGLIASKFQRQDVAIDLFLRSIESQPNEIKSYTSLAAIFEQESYFSEAQHLLETAIFIHPKSSEAHYQLASVLYKQGQLVEAEKVCNEVIRINTKNDDAYNLLGVIYQEQGQFENARKKYRKAIRINQSKYESYYYLSNTKKFARNDSDLNELKKIFARDKQTSDPNFNMIVYALGKAHHDIKDYEAAFNFFSEANQRKKELNPYDKESSEALLKQIEIIFSEQVISDKQHSGYESETPLFIVGMPRSGTSLVEQIIAGHSQVYGAGENVKLGQMALATATTKTKYPESLIFTNKSRYAEIGKEYVLSLEKLSSSATYIIDKMPSNFMLIGFIHLILPKAKIIHCTRDPIATSFSCFRTGFSDSHYYCNDLEDLGSFYRHYLALMEHWRRVLPNKILDIKYEHLVNNTEDSVKNILEYLELPWDENCLNYDKNEGAVKTASLWQVRQPIYTSSLNSWKNYQEYLQPLIQQLEREK
jgi:tetratricopeptide (TPR) repeat protein